MPPTPPIDAFIGRGGRRPTINPAYYSPGVPLRSATNTGGGIPSILQRNSLINSPGISGLLESIRSGRSGGNGTGGGGVRLGGRYGGVSGARPPAGPYGTGPNQHRLLPDQLNANPSQESLTRARIEQAQAELEKLNNKGAGARYEDALASARGQASQSLASSGISRTSLLGAQIVNEGVLGATDAALGREAEEARRIKQLRAEGQFQIAGLEEERARDLFNQYAQQESLRLDEERLNLQAQAQQAQQIAQQNEAFLQMQSSPMFQQLVRLGMI